MIFEGECAVGCELPLKSGKSDATRIRGRKWIDGVDASPVEPDRIIGPGDPCAPTPPIRRPAR